MENIDFIDWERVTGVLTAGSRSGITVDATVLQSCDAHYSCNLSINICQLLRIGRLQCRPPAQHLLSEKHAARRWLLC